MYLSCPSPHLAIVRRIMRVRMKAVSWDLREAIGGRRAEKGEKKEEVEKVERKAREELGRKLPTTEEESWQDFRAELI